MGKVMEVDVADTGVQWGRYLRVRVEVDVTRKLIRGRKINLEGEEARWVHFKYECLPNFCYRCGLLEHDLKECLESAGSDKVEERGDLQYGAWLRGEPARRSGGEYSFANKKEGGDTRSKPKFGLEGGRIDLVEPRRVVARDEQVTEVSILEEDTLGKLTKKSNGGELTAEAIHQNGNDRNLGENTRETLAQLGKKNWESGIELGGKGGSMEKVTGTQHSEIPKFDFKSALQDPIYDCQVGLALDENKDGLVAMMYKVDVGWVAESLGPNSGH